METKKVLLSEIKENELNPRYITPANMERLTDSLLVFPKMLDLRQVVINQNGIIIGGNMRFRALQAIFGMGDEETTTRIEKHAHKRSLTPNDVSELIKRWAEWRKKPEVEVVSESLDENEEKQFIIKDNVNAGDWDMEALEGFDEDDLQEFGVQTWGSVDGFMNYDDSDTEDIGGSTVTSSCDERQRIIIMYPMDRKDEVRQLLCLDELKKPSYKIEELISNCL